MQSAFPCSVHRMMRCLCLLLLSALLPGTAAAGADSFFSSAAAADKLPYTTWLADNASSYDHNTFLSTTADSTKGMAIFWKVSGEDFHVAFATTATGWAAFGIAQAGGMFGADVVSFTTSNPTELVDGYILDDRMVRVDARQDWSLISSVVDDGWIIVEATRLIDTGDTQDNALRNDKELWVAPSRIIAAWGDTESVSYHGENRASSSVRIFADSSSSNAGSEALLDVLTESSDGYFDVVADAYEIPAQETKYKYLCKTYEELNEQFGGETDVTMIGATPIITEETRQFVHHFIVMTVPGCKDLLGGDSIFKREQIYGWAPGDEGMVLPDSVGFPLFDSEDNQAILIEIHYNNPNRVSGMKDSSGVRFHFTTTPRLHKAAILQIGDPMLGLWGVEINDGFTKHEFTCPGTCSSLFLDEPVTVLQEKLHMHQTGKRMVNEIIRGGEVFHKSSVEVFDFEQQGGFLVQQEAFQLQAGDQFRTTCYYKDGTVFKEGSQEEMCIGFLLYYPAKKFAGFPFICPYPGQFPCAEEYVSTDLSDYDGLGRTFGTPGEINLSNETLSLLPQPVTVPVEPPTQVPIIDTPTAAGTGDSQSQRSDNPTPATTSKAEETRGHFFLFVIALSFAATFITHV